MDENSIETLFLNSTGFIMKIGILTIHNSPNYGACLQCYALWKYLTDLGHDTEIIDLHRPLAHADYVPSKRFTRARPPKQSIVSRIKSLFFQNKKIITSLYSENAKSVFEKFNEQVKMGPAYTGIDELYANPPKYDIYIAGSDQLWNPTQVYCIEPYFLTFVKLNGARKLSYATSLGITHLLENEKKLFAEWISDFDAISVRERQAQNILQKIVNKKIHQVADPTFLIDTEQWKQLSVVPKEKEYILLFSLTPNTSLLEYAKNLKNESGKSLIVIGQKEIQPTDDSYKVINNAGPAEWIGYLGNADLVITNSFHATVFSLLMGAENFYTYIANDRGSRIEDLLETFHLQSHILRGKLSKSYNDLLSDEISQNDIKKVVEQERHKGRRFLSDNLK